MRNLTFTGMTAVGLVLAACGGSGSSGGSGGGGTPGPLNVAPVAQAGSETMLQNADTVEITLVATDADGDALTYAISAQPTSGTATISGDVVSYTPDTDFSGMDSFSFTANDGTVNSAAAAVDLTVQPTSSFQGKMSESDGTRVSNITVSALDGAGEVVTTAISDADGEFTLTAVTAQDLVLNFSSPDYADQVLPVTMPDLKSMTVPLEVTVIARGAVQTIDIDAGGTLGGDSGASVTLNAGSFVDANGAAVTGNIDAQITPVDISNGQTLAAFPGDFAGVEELSGNETAIASLGTVEYIFTQNGEPLQLGNGATAEIEIPIYTAIDPATGDPIEMGDEIALWSLSEDTGIWTQEGTGIVVANTDSPTGLALKATVDHFTWWNCDIAVDRADVDITLNGTVDGGVAVIRARTQSGWGFRSATRNVTVGSTTSGLIIPANTTTCFWIDYTDVSGDTAQSDEQCIDDAIADTTYPLTFNVQTAGSLVLGTPRVASSYFVDDPLSISFSPRSLETAVSYTVTSGTLPAGLTLTGNGSTATRIIGTPSAIETQTVTIEGTDSDGFTDSKTITLSIIDTPPPSLRAVSTVYATVGDPVSRSVTVNNNGADDPTSWIVTLADGSAVPGGVSITSAGVFTINSFDGIDRFYLVTAYNSKGASNSVTIEVRDVATSPPVLVNAYPIFLLEGSGQYTEDISTFANSGAPATSWTIVGIGGTPTSGASITNAGVLTLQANGFFPDIENYEVVAFNGSLQSNTMIVTLHYEMIDDCLINPDPNFC